MHFQTDDEAILQSASTAAGAGQYLTSKKLLTDYVLANFGKIEYDHLIKHTITALNASVLSANYDKLGNLLENLTEMTPHIHPRIVEWLFPAIRQFNRSFDISQLLNWCDLHLRKSDSFLAPAIIALREGAARRMALCSSVRLISIGNGCYPWMQLNRFGLRNDITLADDQLPFNLAFSRPAGIAKAIGDDFSEFHDPTKYRIVTSAQGIQLGSHSSYSMAFNHECEPHLFEDNFSGLRAIYCDRADRFIRTCHAGRRCFVFIPVAPEDVPMVASALRRKSKDDLYRIVALDHRPEPTHEAADDFTRVIHIPYPSKNYFWVNDSNSQDGVVFDIRVRDAIERVMEEIAA